MLWLFLRSLFVLPTAQQDAERARFVVEKVSSVFLLATVFNQRGGDQCCGKQITL